MLQVSRVDRTTDYKMMLAILVIWMAMWLIVLPWGNFAVDDDWAYAYAVQSILKTGQFSSTGYSAPNLIAQAYWGALFCLPFGFSYEALRVSTCVLALLGLCTAFKLLRELGGGRRVAAVGAMTLGANPLYLHLSASFMTDVPFTALSVTSLWLYIRGVRRSERGVILGGFAVALLALLIRQFALFLPVAFGASLLVRRGFGLSSLTAAVAPVLLFAAAHTLFQDWAVATGRVPLFAETIGTFSQISIVESLSRTKFFVLAMLPYFGLFCLPLLIYTVLHRPEIRAGGWRAAAFWPASAVLGAALFAVMVYKRDILPPMGSVLIPSGIGPLYLHDVLLLHKNEPEVAGAGVFWTLLTAAGTWATVVLGLFSAQLVLRLLRAVRSIQVAADEWPRVLLLTFVIGNVAAVLLATLLGPVFDRYLLPTVLPLCAFLLVSVRPRDHISVGRGLLAASALAACAVLSVLACHDYFTLSRARSEATNQLERDGIPPSLIDGGYEYSGMRLFELGRKAPLDKSWWWIVDDQYMIALGPVPGYDIMRAVSFTRWLWPGHGTVKVLQRR